MLVAEEPKVLPYPVDEHLGHLDLEDTSLGEVDAAGLNDVELRHLPILHREATQDNHFRFLAVMGA